MLVVTAVGASPQGSAARWVEKSAACRPLKMYIVTRHNMGHWAMCCSLSCGRACERNGPPRTRRVRCVLRLHHISVRIIIQ